MAPLPPSSQTADPAHVIETARALIASLLKGCASPAGNAAAPDPRDRPPPVETERDLSAAPVSVPGHDFL